MSVMIVSAADQSYATLLIDLLDSLVAAKADAHATFGVLDLGLDDATLETLRTRGVALARPAWPFRAHAVFDARPYYLSRAVKAFLPTYFPGHETYVWLDADCWVQDGEAIAHLCYAASTGALAAVPTADRSYVHPVAAQEWVFRRHEMALGRNSAEALRQYSYINSGVWALRGDAQLWIAWQTRFQKALDTWEGTFLSDQAILNGLIYLDRFRHVFLPAEYNWIVHLRLPLWHVERQRFVNPNFPWAPIRILHNTFNDKTHAPQVPTSRTEPICRPLTYGCWRAALGHSGQSS